MAIAILATTTCYDDDLNLNQFFEDIWISSEYFYNVDSMIWEVSTDVREFSTNNFSIISTNPHKGWSDRGNAKGKIHLTVSK